MKVKCPDSEHGADVIARFPGGLKLVGDSGAEPLPNVSRWVLQSDAATHETRLRGRTIEPNGGVRLVIKE